MSHMRVGWGVSKQEASAVRVRHWWQIASVGRGDNGNVTSMRTTQKIKAKTRTFFRTVTCPDPVVIITSPVRPEEWNAVINVVRTST